MFVIDILTINQLVRGHNSIPDIESIVKSTHCVESLTIVVVVYCFCVKPIQPRSYKYG